MKLDSPVKPKTKAVTKPLYSDFELSRLRAIDASTKPYMTKEQADFHITRYLEKNPDDEDALEHMALLKYSRGTSKDKKLPKDIVKATLKYSDRELTCFVNRRGKWVFYNGITIEYVRSSLIEAQLAKTLSTTR